MNKKMNHQETVKEKTGGFDLMKIKSIFRQQRQYGHSEQYNFLKNENLTNLFAAIYIYAVSYYS